LRTALSALDLKRQRDRNNYARPINEQKAQRNTKRRENYARKKAGISQQVLFASGNDSKNMIDSDVATAVPASGACRIYQIYIHSDEHNSINMVD